MPLTVLEERIEAERSEKYRGVACVGLEFLKEWKDPTELSRETIDKLRRTFEIEVRRGEPRNHILAEVDQSDLDRALEDSGISAERLLSNTPPTLKLTRLKCIHGQHRIQAARETDKLVEDAWWTVDLYLQLSPELGTNLIEEYSNERKRSDGEIYRKIRQYEKKRNYLYRDRWKSFLSSTGLKGYKLLTGKNDGRFKSVFDDLLDIPAMWAGLRLTTVHKMVDMKCDMEVEQYPKNIKNVWCDRLFLGDTAALQKVSQADVKALELKAPKYSKRDNRELEGKVRSGEIFGAFSREERNALWDRLSSIDCLIPSLSTFFEDLKYLERCAACLKRLVKLSGETTLKDALANKLRDKTSDRFVLEVDESTYVNLRIDNIRCDLANGFSPRFELVYRQLFLRAMRDYRKLPPDTKKEEKHLKAKPVLEKADEVVVFELAAFAQRLGFATDQISDILNRSPDLEIARHALLKARKPDRFRYDDTLFESYAEQIRAIFTRATPVPSQPSIPSLVSENPLAARSRCGLPDMATQEKDRKYLFLSQMHNESEEQGESITSYFVRRSVYLAFFGKLMDIRTHVLPQSEEQTEQDTSRSDGQAHQEKAADFDRQNETEQEKQKEKDLADEARRVAEEARIKVGFREAVKTSTNFAVESRFREFLREDERVAEAARLKQARKEARKEAREEARGEKARENHRHQDREARENGDRTAPDPELPLAPHNYSIPRPQVFGAVNIRFQYYSRGAWREVESFTVTDPTDVERKVIKYMRKKEVVRVYDIDLSILSPQSCYQAAIDNNYNMLLLIPGEHIDITKELEDSVKALLSTEDEDEL